MHRLIADYYSADDVNLPKKTTSWKWVFFPCRIRFLLLLLLSCSVLDKLLAKAVEKFSRCFCSLPDSKITISFLVSTEIDHLVFLLLQAWLRSWCRLLVDCENWNDSLIRILNPKKKNRIQNLGFFVLFFSFLLALDDDTNCLTKRSLNRFLSIWQNMCQQI